jgi:hypothetical protein
MKTRSVTISSHRRYRSRGIALMLVMAVVAMATILGLAMLSSTTIQATVTVNSAQSCDADYLAESGLQAAMYYLQYPQDMPNNWGTTSGYVIKASNERVGAASLGTFDVQVVKNATRDVYDITTTGKPAHGSATKTSTARVKVDRKKITGGAYFGGAITIPARTTITGPVQSASTVNNLSGTALTSVQTGSPTPLPRTSYITPTVSTVNFYGADGTGAYTTPDGAAGTPQQLLAAPTSTPSVASNNPGKIFYYNGDLTIASPVTIVGTLIVKNGSLTIKAANVQIQPAAGYPAIVVERDLSMYRLSVSLTANGVVWVGRNIVWTSLVGANTGSSLTINGALLMPAGSVINAPGTGGATNVTYTAANADVPDLAKSMQPGQTVKILNWNQ